ncbi:MAG: hypothetical protein JWO73_198 [Candidatus Taylorbacteria bacterium]|nr:hypothetical protein [Candidatus Taylorbacteria bacterium]
MKLSSHAVAVLMVAPEGIPLIRDPKKPVPRYWKLPGGRSEASETPEKCAAREVAEETGLEIDIDNLVVIEQQDRGTHVLTIFRIDLASLKGLKGVGDEHEEIRIFPKSELATMPDLFPNHKTILISSGSI